MKKSNKLLVVLFLFITAALTLFNVLLNAQLKQGKFRSDYDELHRVTIALKPFQHVVYDGRMNLEYSKWSSSWVDRTINISTGENLKYSLEMPSNMKSILNYRYQGDTLFVNFNRIEKGGRGAYVPESADIPLRLLAPGLSSVSTNYGITNLINVDQQTPLALYVKNTQQFTLANFRLPVMHVHADTLSQIKVFPDTRLDTMVLSMVAGSALTFYTPIHIKTIEPRQLDSNANIGITGRQVNMKEFLQKFE